MSDTLLAGVIGAVATLLSSVGTFLVTRWSDRRVYQLVGTRRASLRGTWRGVFTQTNLPPDIQPRSIELTFEPGRRRVKGMWTTHGIYRGKDLVLRFSVTGGFHYDRFLKLDYVPERANRIQFGSAMLELSADGEQLSGAFVGFGAISQMIVHGTIQMQRT